MNCPRTGAHPLRAERIERSPTNRSRMAFGPRGTALPASGQGFPADAASSHGQGPGPCRKRPCVPVSRHPHVQGRQPDTESDAACLRASPLVSAIRTASAQRSPGPSSPSLTPLPRRKCRQKTAKRDVGSGISGFSILLSAGLKEPKVKSKSETLTKRMIGRRQLCEIGHSA